MHQNELNALEQNIKEAKKLLNMGTALERLRDNRDFKQVIQQGYFEQEAIRLVHLRADPAMQTPDRMASINKMLDSIGVLNQFFEQTYRNADMATQAIAADEETRAEILREDSSNV